MEPAEPEGLGATGDQPEGVPAGPEAPGMTVELTMALVSVSQGVVAAAEGAVVEAPGMTVDLTISLVSVSQGVVVAGAEPWVVEAPGITVDFTISLVSVSQGVVLAAAAEVVWLDPSLQSTSPRTARHRLMGMLIRPPLSLELCWQ